MLLTATRIHDGFRFLPEGTVIETDENGLIITIHEQIPKGRDVVHYDGILCPGFVNAHCHIELSHMKGMIPEHTGLIPFLQTIPVHRNDFTEEQIKVARHEAYQELLKNGVVAVGDIANLDQTKDVRALDQLHVHTFVESIGFTPSRAELAFSFAEKVYEEFSRQESGTHLLSQSIVPHAPYSVSRELFALISEYNKGKTLSIHNQESRAENEFYLQGTGDVITLLNGLGIDHTTFRPSGKTSLQTYSQWLSAERPLMLVHNTQTTAEDIAVMKNRFPKVYWCLCPNANLYIENRLPGVPMLQQSGFPICIGTDSLASNHQLSILSELVTLHQYFSISWEKLLRWATYNGAAALGFETIVGSLQPGKQPGILYLDFKEAVPQVRRIV